MVLKARGKNRAQAIRDRSKMTVQRKSDLSRMLDKTMERVAVGETNRKP